MDLLLELDTTIVVELAELATELSAELDKLDTTTMTEELFWELSLDELELFKDPSEEDVRPTLDDVKELDKEDTAALDDKGEDKEDELNTATEGLVTAATEVLEKALPPPPPQAFKKATAKHPRLSLSVREGLKGCM